MSLDTIELETSGKWEKMEKKDAVRQLEDIKDIKKYLEKLSTKERENRFKNPEIQKQVALFLENAANNKLPKHLEKLNSKKFDTDGESGLDQFEFEQFSTAMKWSIEQIIALDGITGFDRAHFESKQEGGWSNPDKWIAEKADLLKLAFWEWWIGQLTDDTIKKLWTLSEEEVHTMSEKIFSPTNTESWKELAIILGKELGNGVEWLLKFLSNIPAGIILLPRYMGYRIDANSADITKKTEGEIKLTELVEENNSLAIVDLLGEKWIQMVQELWKMMKSGKQWDIAKVLVTIAGLIAGWAGVIKFVSSRARKTAVNNARKAGSEWRTVESRNMRNWLKEVSKTAGRVAEVANKVDSIVSTAWTWHIINMVWGRISEDANKKVEQTKNRTKVEKSKDLPTAIKLNEDIANEAKVRGVDENLVRKERLIKNEWLSSEQADRVIVAHAIRRKWEGLGKYGITNLKEKIKTMIEGDGWLTIDQARNMLKKWYAGVIEDTEKILQKINIHGIDSLTDAIEWKKITQPQLNAMVSEYSKEYGFDPKKLDTLLRDTFDISGYDGDQASMLQQAIAYTKETQLKWLISKIKDISANTILDHLKWWSEWNEDLVRAFLKDGNPSTKKDFLKALETNDSLRNNILTGKIGWDFIKVLWENYTTQNKLITNIIGDEKLLKTLSSETLKGLDSILSKMMQENIITGGFADTLKTKLGLARNANSPANKIAYFLQNGDEKIAELLRVTSTEKNVWNMLFDNLRSTDNWIIQQLNMVKRWEPSFFNVNDLGNFFNGNFWDLEKWVQKEFVKAYITPTDGKYHTVLEQFPGFKRKLEEKGFI